MNRAAETPRAAPIVVTGVGFDTPIGRCAAQAYTSVRAGINRFEAWSIAGGDRSSDDGEALVSPIAGRTGGAWGEQAARLATGALRESLCDAGWFTPEDLAAEHGRSAFSAHLALPYADRAGIDRDSWLAFEQDARSHCVIALQTGDVHLLPRGHAAGLLAVEQAAQRLRLEETDMAVVIGIDSLLTAGHLAWLDDRNKLKTDYRPSGLIPGEGAAAVVLERLDDARRRQAPIYGELAAVGAAHEEIPFDGPEPTQAAALGRAVQDVLARCGRDPGVFGDVLCDLNGERGRFLEWGLIETRCLRLLRDGWRLHHPVDCTGDLGAATGVFLLGLGAGLLRWGHALRQGVLIAAASERGERACAALVAAAPAAES